MQQDILAVSSIQLKASPARVWEALTDPDMIKEYFFGTKARSEWIEGSPIVFTGEWQGQQYQDKGTILQTERHKLLMFDYWSSMSGKEDIPENYAVITYKLTPKDDGTLLTVTQDNIADESGRQESERNWNTVLTGLKELLERGY